MPIKYIPYYPNTVEGQAILDNITRTQRTLRYRENDRIYDRIKRGMPYYEVEPLETVGEPSENLVIRGECISACAYLKEKGIKVDLVYVDPPFASGADYAKKVYLRRNPKIAEKLAVAEQEMDIEDLKRFEEKMYGDIWKKEDYLNWMYENLVAIKSVMSDSASIYFHIDWHIGHYVKILMDEVFGEDCFLNQIIWKRTPFAGSSKARSQKYPVNHDLILFYAKNSEVYSFVNQYIEYKEEYLERFKHEDSFGFYRKTSLKTYSAVTKKWLKDNDRWIDAVKEDAYPSYKQYLHESKGKQVEDIWSFEDDNVIEDLNSANPMANERTGYATQKPEVLVERIIKASSKEKYCVADFFGGSGVTSKVASDLGRKFIHVDVGINSIQTARDRLKEAKANFQILEIKDGVSLFRNPQQTMDKLVTLIPGLQKGVKGINSFWFGVINNSKDGIVPVYVPNILNTQEKVLDIPTINTIINQELQNLEVNVKKVIVYYIDIDDQNALEKFIKDNNATEIEVELKDLKNLLHDVVIEDIIDFKTTKIKDGYETEITKFISDRLIQKIHEFNQKGNLQSITKGKEFTPISISEEGLELIELVAVDCENIDGQWHSTTEVKIDKLGYMIKDGIKSKNFWDGKIYSIKEPKRFKIRNISGDETILMINNT